MIGKIKQSKVSRRRPPPRLDYRDSTMRESALSALPEFLIENLSMLDSSRQIKELVPIKSHERIEVQVEIEYETSAQLDFR